MGFHTQHLKKQRGIEVCVDSTHKLMAEEKTRVDFTAPKSLVERADSVVEIVDISRTRPLIDALEDELEELANDEEFHQRLNDAYYNGRVDSDTIHPLRARNPRDSLRGIRRRGAHVLRRDKGVEAQYVTQLRQKHLGG